MKDDEVKIATIRFDMDDYEWLKRAAKKEGLDVSSYVRRCALLYSQDNHADLRTLS